MLVYMILKGTALELKYVIVKLALCVARKRLCSSHDRRKFISNQLYPPFAGLWICSRGRVLWPVATAENQRECCASRREEGSSTEQTEIFLRAVGRSWDCLY